MVFIKGHKTNKGKHWKVGKEGRKRMSKGQKGKKNPHSKEWNKKISKANKGQIPWSKGKKLSKEHIEKVRKANTGKKRSDEIKKKLSKIHIGLQAKENHPNWQGGMSFEPYSIDWTETLRRSIRERDHYTCQLYGIYGNVVHHIDYDKKNCDPKNLITLSKKGNSVVNFNRKYWTNYFQNIMCKRLELCSRL